jgi:hypothetical protein
MEGGIKRHRSRRKKQEKVENLEMEKRDKRVSLSVKIRNYSQSHSADFQSNDQKKLDEKEEFVIDRQADKEERKKMMLMWGGVIFFMVIIIIGWAVMFRQSFGVAKTNGQSLLDWQKWNQTASDIGKNFDATAEQLKTMKSLLTQVAAQNASGTNISTVLAAGTSTKQIDQADLNRIKEEIINLEKTKK